MSKIRELAESYHLRARLLRAIANMECRSVTRMQLAEIAEDYEKRAQHAEAIEESYRALQKH